MPKFEETTNMRHPDGSPEGRNLPLPSHLQDATGRQIRGGPCKHRERHPVDVEGCFGCKVCGQSAWIPPYMSARGSGIETAAELRREHEAIARANPDRYQRVGGY